MNIDRTEPAASAGVAEVEREVEARSAVFKKELGLFDLEVDFLREALNEAFAEPSARSRPPRSILAGAIRLWCADRDEGFQLQKVLLADAGDVHQFLDLLERPVLLAVLDDPGRRLGADTG